MEKIWDFLCEIDFKIGGVKLKQILSNLDFRGVGVKYIFKSLKFALKEFSVQDTLNDVSSHVRGAFDLVVWPHISNYC